MSITTLITPDDLPEFRARKDQFLLAMRIRNCSDQTVANWTVRLDRFTAWCGERGMTTLAEVTPQVLAAYQRWLYHYRSAKTHKPLKFNTQLSYLMPVKRWFVWLAQEGILPDNMAADLELPKEEKRLPAAVLRAEEVERVINATDISKPLGLRDRALLEALYSTAMRCGELVSLQVYDLEPERRIITIRRGKGRKDRVVPIGRRALAWVEKYLVEVRPQFVAQSNESTMFVSSRGHRIGRTSLSAIVRRYVVRAGVSKPGSVHLMRHTAATLMLEAGADLRSLQLYLGHEKLNTTQLYTHISIARLSDVHERTHPAEAPPAQVDPTDGSDEDSPDGSGCE